MAQPPNKFLSVSQSTFDNVTMADDLDMACESGARAIALSARMVRQCGTKETVSLLRERNLGISSIHLGLKLLELEEDAAVEALQEGLALAASVNAPVAAASPGSCGTRTAAEADEAYLRRLQAAAPTACALNVTMGIEPLHPFLHPMGYIHTIRHAARLAKRVEGCGIILDVAQVYWDCDLFDDIEKHVETLCLVQVTSLDGEALKERRWMRARIESGIVPVAAVLRAVDAAGYRGYYESEILVDLTHDESIEAARSARLWFEKIWPKDGVVTA